ncbi:MAG: ribonuclease HI [Kiritimatiellae bacterium]|jgi:ribonuclease HI|nr:ribonuclease HI [Kiritimatiellia bacterium]
MDSVEIYSDGACKGNPGPGGTGTILISGELRKELSSGYRKTTNNRMELMAAIAGLSVLRKRCAVELYSDSKYVVESMEYGRVQVWKANNWKKKNRDLWLKMLDLCQKHDVKFIWVKGHADNEFNNRCDELAVEATAGEEFEIDEWYEAEVARLEAQGELFGQ